MIVRQNIVIIGKRSTITSEKLKSLFIFLMVIPVLTSSIEYQLVAATTTRQWTHDYPMGTNGISPEDCCLHLREELNIIKGLINSGSYDYEMNCLR